MRNVTQWSKKLEGFFPREAARTILKDLSAYRDREPPESDIQNLANALAAGNWRTGE